MKFVNTLYVFFLLIGCSSCTDFPCDSNVFYEEIPCGAPQYRSAFCQPTRPGSRLISVYLMMTSKYHSACVDHNFGLTSEHDRVWVHKWCYGTFLVCFTPVRSDLEKTKTLTHLQMTTSTLKTAINSNETHSEYLSTKNPRMSNKGTELSKALSPSMTSTNAVQKVISQASAESSFPQRKISTQNILNIGAICLIGLLIIAIVTVAVFKYIRNDKSVEGYEQGYNLPNVTSQTDCEFSADQPSVYDTIPFDTVSDGPARTISMANEASVSQRNTRRDFSTKHVGYSQVGQTLDEPCPYASRNIYSHTSDDTEYDRISQSGRRFQRSSSTYSHTSEFFLEPVYNEPIDSTARTVRLSSVNENEYATVHLSVTEQTNCSFVTQSDQTINVNSENLNSTEIDTASVCR